MTNRTVTISNNSLNLTEMMKLPADCYSMAMAIGANEWRELRALIGVLDGLIEQTRTKEGA